MWPVWDDLTVQALIDQWPLAGQSSDPCSSVPVSEQISVTI